MIYLKYFSGFCLAFILIYAIIASFRHEDSPKREIFIDPKWPYWIPDPFNLAFLGVVTIVVLTIFVLWG